MLVRKMACAAVILLLSCSIVVAVEIRGKINSLKDGKISFQERNKDDKTKFEDAKTYDLAKDVKVSKKTKKGKDDLADGLKAEVFKNIDEAKGVSCTIVVGDDKMVSEIILQGGKKKGT